MKRFKKIIIIFALFASILLSSCGLTPRRAADVPPQLHTMALKTKRSYSNLITQLKAMLHSLDITLVSNSDKAPYTLEISNINFRHSNPPINTTLLARTITYTLSIKVRLVSRRGKIIIPEKSISASRTISQNPSQVYTPGAATLAKQELRRDIISKLYYVLVSNNTRKALNNVH